MPHMKTGGEERAGLDIKALRIPSPQGPGKAHNVTTTPTVTMAAVVPAAMVPASQKSFRFPLEVLLNRNTFYTGPPEKPTSSRYYATTAREERRKSKFKEKKKRALTPIIQTAKYWGLLYLGML